MNHDWWKKAVFYQIYPRSFMDSDNDGIGDLQGILTKLDYLNNGTPDSLGIDAIWFSPFFKSPDYDYGYDISDYRAIDPRYGSLDDLQQLLEEAHKRNIKVILDLVVNHTSHLHPWFLESRSSRENPKRDWYIWKDGRNNKNKPPNNWRNHFFGPAWTWDEMTEQYYLHSFLSEQPDLNWSNPEVIEAIGDVIRFWLDFGVDGFRLDVAHHYSKDLKMRNNPLFISGWKDSLVKIFSDRTFLAGLMKLFALPTMQLGKYNQHQPETHHIIKGFRNIFNQYPGTTSVGEIMGDNPELIASYYGQNNDELHMNFYFEMLHLRWKAAAFRRCVDRWEKALPSGAWPAHALSNHDIMRAVSRYNNDNRTDERARLLMLMLLTLRGTPFIYYGEEIAMREAKLSREQLKDPVGLRWYPLHRGRDGCRTPMQWSGDIYAGFSDVEPWLPVGPGIDKHNVSAMESDSHSFLSFTKTLIWMRKEMPALLEGDYKSTGEEGLNNDCFCYQRSAGKQRLLICLNFSPQRQEISMPGGNADGRLVMSTSFEIERRINMKPLVLKGLEGCIIEI